MNSNRHILKDGTQLHGKDYLYEIVELLGQGSFGITYLAKVCLKGSLGVIQGNIYVAIKEFYMADVNSRVGTRVDSGTESGLFHAYHSRFQKEALNLARMNHPGIVKVMEVFDENNTSYMVMEFLAGGTLDCYIKEKKSIPENEAKTIITQIAQALSYMHDRQMLHLDLKPGNIMLREDNQPVLIDFGLSKHYNENGIPETSTPIGLGTPGYAPLEQSEYQESDGFQPTMDVYALGATLFKTLTGQAPPTAATVLNKPSLLNDLMVGAGVSQATRDLVLSAMQPLRKARPQSVQAFLDKMDEKFIVEEDDDESTLIDNPSDRVQYKHTDVENKPLQTEEKESEKAFLSFKNNIATIDNRFVDKNNHEIIVFNPITTRLSGITCLLLVIFWVAQLVIYSNSHLLHKLFPTLGLYVSQSKNIITVLTGQMGFIVLICFTFLISILYIMYYIHTYQKAYKSEQVVDKSILDNYEDYAYLMTNGLLAVKKDDKWGFINRRGKIIIPLTYDKVNVFKDGKAKVVSNDEEMMINTKGKRIDN